MTYCVTNITPNKVKIRSVVTEKIFQNYYIIELV